MTTNTSHIIGWAIVLLVALVILIALAYTSWYLSMTPSGKRNYWIVGGIILIIIAIMLLYYVFKKPKTLYT